MPMRVAIYCRISKDPDGDSTATDRQEQDCRALAAERGYDVVEVYVDSDRSAYREDVVRSRYEALLAAMDAGEIDGVIVWKLDRLMRRIVEFSRFWAIAAEHDVALVSKHDPVDTTTPLGLAVVYLIVALAEQESRNTSLRARRRHLEIAQEGGLSGGGHRPFGFEPDRVTVRPDEAKEIRDAARRALAGASLRSITHDWQDRGIVTVTGAMWQATTIRRLLCSGRISGQREHLGKIVGPAVWPAIIDPEDTARLRVVLNGGGPGYGSARSYLLTGFVVCGACGTVMSARAANRKKGGRSYRYRRYHCAKDRGGCDRVGISAARLEDWIVAMVTSRLDQAAIAALRAARGGQDDTLLIETVQRLEAKLDQFARDCADDLITRSEYLAARGPMVERLQAARVQLAGQRPATALDGLEGDLRVVWPSLAFDRQRAILGMVLESVTVGPTTRANNRFDESRFLPPQGEVRWKM